MLVCAQPKCNHIFIKLPAEKPHCITNWYADEEGNHKETDKDVIKVT
jgi:hypothetical protein